MDKSSGILVLQRGVDKESGIEISFQRA